MGSTGTDPYAQRAALAHAALRRGFERPDGMLRRDGALHRPGAVAHLWPFARAFVATLDLAGIPARDDGGLAALIERRLDALERYWDPRSAAYASDPPGGRIGGDVYYDDNAWVGLGLVQLARMCPGRDLARPLERAARILAFAREGWARDPDLPHPGGVFWVAQGRGIGARNHDRNLVSTAPIAELALHLGELGGAAVPAEPGPDAMADWVEATLDADGEGTGLFWDKIRGDGSIDRARWSYNQGSMIGLDVLLATAHDPRDDTGRLARAEAIAAKSLDHYADTGYAGEPAAFVAIYVRNLLILHARTQRAELRDRIRAALRERADAAWAATHAASHGRRRGTLLDVSALVSLQALVAWDPADYARLA